MRCICQSNHQLAESDVVLTLQLSKDEVDLEDFHVHGAVLNVLRIGTFRDEFVGLLFRDCRVHLADDLQLFSLLPVEVLDSFGEARLVKSIFEEFNHSWRHRVEKNFDVLQIVDEVVDRVLLAHHRNFHQALPETSTCKVETLLLNRFEADCSVIIRLQSTQAELLAQPGYRARATASFSFVLLLLSPLSKNCSPFCFGQFGMEKVAGWQVQDPVKSPQETVFDIIALGILLPRELHLF